jgi:hypothetical protein
MLARILVVVLALGAASCGITSINCNNAATFTCLSASISSGIFNPTCIGTQVDTCPSGAIARCLVIATATTNGKSTTTTSTYSYYPGADTASFQTACASAGGTWSTP